MGVSVILVFIHVSRISVCYKPLLHKSKGISTLNSCDLRSSRKARARTSSLRTIISSSPSFQPHRTSKDGRGHESPRVSQVSPCKPQSLLTVPAGRGQAKRAVLDVRSNTLTLALCLFRVLHACYLFLRSRCAPLACDLFLQETKLSGLASTLRPPQEFVSLIFLYSIFVDAEDTCTEHG